MRTASSWGFTLVEELFCEPLFFAIAPPLFAPTILPVQPAAPGSGLPGAAPCGTFIIFFKDKKKTCDSDDGRPKSLAAAAVAAALLAAKPGCGVHLLPLTSTVTTIITFIMIIMMIIMTVIRSNQEEAPLLRHSLPPPTELPASGRSR